MIRLICALFLLPKIAAVVVAADATPTNSAHVWTGRATNSSGALLATITVDSSEAPDLEEWARQVGETCVLWYPKINELLASPNAQPYSQVHIALKEMKGVAGTGGANIDVSAGYVRQNRKDVGMVIHELTHVVQAYPPNNAGWLVEGIADYVRLMHFEPDAPRPHVNPEKASYRDAYKTTAAFLEWIEKNHDKKIVNEVNRALREQTFKKELFKECTGKTVDELWAEYIESLKKTN